MKIQTSDHVDVELSGEKITLDGQLTVPENPQGLVVFAHGSGSSRHSPRNRFVAEQLNQANMATLLFDLLTPEEDVEDQQSRRLRFDIPLLAQRLIGTIDWLPSQESLYGLKIGLFGASTGSAAALIAAAQRPLKISAVVSRGGRPDLAGEHLSLVQAPTLLIVGGRDQLVIELNEEARNQLLALNHLKIVPGATHLFEEPGKLEEVARLSSEWFQKYLPPSVST